MEQIDNLQLNISINKQIEKIPAEKAEVEPRSVKVQEDVKKPEKTELKIKPEELLEPINSFFSSNRTNVKFGSAKEEEGAGITFKVVDANTGEIIKEFPEDEIGKLYESTKSSNGLGVLVDSDA